MSEMTPREIVAELDRHIIGQDAAKKAVALALRNRWRRMNVDPQLRQEITPKNILMIGPTGVGKTEIARRLSKLADAPFIKVEATKFTEVGYVGKEVDSIIRDLMETAFKMVRERKVVQNTEQARIRARERVLDALMAEQSDEASKEDPLLREELGRQLDDGELKDTEISIDVQGQQMGVEIMGPAGFEDVTNELQGLFEGFGKKLRHSKRLTVDEAMRSLTDEEADSMIKKDDLQAEAMEMVENNGIVFIDEIDKICSRGGDHQGGEVSREGVQRDLLPLIEGCQVKTKHGMVRTDHILFIASGAFASSKPSDLIPELQGRLPIRVELSDLTARDFERILVEPRASLTEQYRELMKTEGVNIEFTDDAVKRIAEYAYRVNETTENIGARRLHTVMEKLCEDVSFSAPEIKGQSVVIDGAYVDARLAELVKDEDLSRYIL